MAAFSQDFFTPKNPEKIIGKAKIYYRSSWELKVMRLLDQHPDVIQWASESVSIPYTNPLTGKKTVYIPDFLVLYKGKNGKNRAELIEVKPAAQALKENANNNKNKAALMLNTAKWAAAMAWCKKNGVEFTVLTENDIFITKKKK